MRIKEKLASLKPLDPIQDRGLRQIRSEYPQAHVVDGRYDDLVVVPGFKLCSGWRTSKLDGYGMEPANICTVLFKRSPGFPAAKPDHFWTDIELRLENLMRPQCSNVHDEIHDFPQWKNVHWFSWHLQMWDPNRDSLYTFVKCIHMRLSPAR